MCLLAHSMPHNTPDTALRAILCFSEPTTTSVPPQSDVYRMLHDNRNEPTQPRQSGSFRVLQELVNDGPGEQPWLSAVTVLMEAVGKVKEGELNVVYIYWDKHTGNENLKTDLWLVITWIQCSYEQDSVIKWVFPQKDFGGAWFRKGASRMYPSSHQPGDKRTPKANSIHSSGGTNLAQKL